MKNYKGFIESYVDDVFANNFSFCYPNEKPSVIISYDELVNNVVAVILNAMHDSSLQEAAIELNQSKALLELVQLSQKDIEEGRVISSSKLKERLATRARIS